MTLRGLQPPAGVLLLLCLVAGNARCQYVDPDVEEPPSLRFVSAGLSFTGVAPLSSNPLGTGAISYHLIMPTLALRQGPVEVLAGYGRYEREGEDHEVVLAAATLATEFPLTGNPEHMLLGTLLLTTDYTKSEAAGPEGETFNVASIGAGAGLGYHILGRSFRVMISAAVAAQYSFEGFRTGSGFSPLLLADAVVTVPGVRLLGGLVAGYRVRLQQWSMSDDRLNYHSFFHGPFLGVSF